MLGWFCDGHGLNRAELQSALTTRGPVVSQTIDMRVFDVVQVCRSCTIRVNDQNHIHAPCIYGMVYFLVHHAEPQNRPVYGSVCRSPSLIFIRSNKFHDFLTPSSGKLRHSIDDFKKGLGWRSSCCLRKAGSLRAGDLASDRPRSIQGSNSPPAEGRFLALQIVTLTSIKPKSPSGALSQLTGTRLDSAVCK